MSHCLLGTKSLLLRVANEDDVGISVTADEAQLPAIKRPVKVSDALRSETGKLLSRRPVKRLLPQIVGILVAEGISYRFAIRREANTSLARMLQRREFRVLWRV